jgi:hypothetical protein
MLPKKITAPGAAAL